MRASLNCALEVIRRGISCKFWYVKITLLLDLYMFLYDLTHGVVGSRHFVHFFYKKSILIQLCFDSFWTTLLYLYCVFFKEFILGFYYFLFFFIIISEKMGTFSDFFCANVFIYLF